MVIEEEIRKKICEKFDATIEEKLSRLIAEGKTIPEHLMECYMEMKKLKETRKEEELI